MRGLVPVEIALVIGIAFIPLPPALPIALPLFIVASLSVWLRRRSWAHVVTFDSTHAVVGVAVGVAALGLALLVGDPLASTLTERSVQWSTDPIVRGFIVAPGAALGGTIILTLISALCFELALRGWIVERVLELSGDRVTAPIMAVLVGAIAEAVITPGDLGARIGAALFAIGLGILYCSAKRNVLAPMIARMTFGVAAVVLQAMQVIG